MKGLYNLAINNLPNVNFVISFRQIHESIFLTGGYASTLEKVKGGPKGHTAPTLKRS